MLSLPVALVFAPRDWRKLLGKMFWVQTSSLGRGAQPIACSTAHHSGGNDSVYICLYC